MPPSSHDGVKVAMPTLDDALDFRGDPASVKVARLGLDLFSVDETVPRSSVEGKESAYGLEPEGRIVVCPYAVGDNVGRVPGCRDGVVRRSSLPLTKRLSRCRCELHLDRIGG